MYREERKREAVHAISDAASMHDRGGFVPNVWGPVVCCSCLTAITRPVRPKKGSLAGAIWAGSLNSSVRS
jgi:hypothetical protein